MRSSQSILKEINPKYSLEELMLKLKLQYFCHLMWRANSLEKTKILAKTEGKRKRVPQRMRLLDSITSSMDMNLSKFWEVVEDGGVWRSTDCQVTESRVWLSSLTTTTSVVSFANIFCKPVACLWILLILYVDPLELGRLVLHSYCQLEVKSIYPQAYIGNWGRERLINDCWAGWDFQSPCALNW